MYHKAFDFTWKSITLTILLLSAIIYSYSYKSRSTPPSGVSVVAQKQVPIEMPSLSNEKGFISKGETVKVLGIGKFFHKDYGCFFWVETKEMKRGLVAQEDLDKQAIVLRLEKKEIHPDFKAGDTVTIVAKELKSKTYTIKSQAGTTTEISYINLVTLIGSQLQDYKMATRAYFFMSKKKFEKLYLNQTFEYNDSLYRYAKYVNNISKTKREAKYDLALFDSGNGRFFYPIVTYENNIAVSYTCEQVKKDNSFLLGFLPGVSKIIDVDFFSNLISGNIYNSGLENYWNKLNNEFYATFPTILGFIFMLFVVIAYLAWIFLANNIGAYLICSLVKIRYPLIFVNNRILKLLIIVMGIVFTYIWLLLGLCYSFAWWFFIPIVIYLIPKVFKGVNNILNNSTRCSRCKRLYTISENRKEFVREYQSIEKEDEKGEYVTTLHRKWQTHDRVTTTYSDGSQSTRNTNYQNHTSSQDIYRHYIYDVTYKNKEYKNIFKCSGCGHETYEISTEREEIDRKLASTYVPGS